MSHLGLSFSYNFEIPKILLITARSMTHRNLDPLLEVVLQDVPHARSLSDAGIHDSDESGTLLVECRPSRADVLEVVFFVLCWNVNVHGEHRRGACHRGAGGVRRLRARPAKPDAEVDEKIHDADYRRREIPH